MKYFSWDSKKNELLQRERGISFEEVIYFIDKGQLLDILQHPNQEKYENQKIFVVNINDYAFLVPYVETESEIFLKTIIPSRKATRKYLGGRNE
jgi:uncharacterized DUF497 family protein